MKEEDVEMQEMVTIGYNIPLDLIIEILIRLPAKSVLRFKSVSKTWRFIISSKQFIDAFMSLSITRPCMVIASYDSNDDRMSFLFSPHQSGSFFEESSMLGAQKNTTMPKVYSYSYDDDHRIDIINSVRGFVCCCLENQFVVCNPITGQVIPLGEKINDDYRCRMYLGYDSNSEQYKVLRIFEFSNSHVEHSVRTLGSQQSSNSWRPINTSILYDYSYNDGVCIDGVVYYTYQHHHNTVLSSFDVGSEQLRLITTPDFFSGWLTNYLGKLAVYRFLDDNGCRLWVLDDVKNQIWSKKICIFQSFTPSMFSHFCFRGVTSSGEIVYVPIHSDSDSDSLVLLCYDVEKKIEKIVEVEGLSIIGPSYPYVLCSYVENIAYL